MPQEKPQAKPMARSTAASAKGPQISATPTAKSTRTAQKTTKPGSDKSGPTFTDYASI